MSLALDHLVIAARTLGEGLDWCEATLGLRPEAGGRHAFMGTHNRVFPIGSAAFPRAYAEIIAIDPEAPGPTQHARWFDLDDAALQRSLAADGPQLVHWVARCDDLTATHAAMRAAGIDCGELHAAERLTPHGLLCWRIGVRADGRRPLGGAAPALIEWGAVHPTEAMAPGAIELRSMTIAGWPERLASQLPGAIAQAMDLGAEPVCIALATPRGPVRLAARRPTVFEPGSG